MKIQRLILLLSCCLSSRLLMVNTDGAGTPSLSTTKNVGEEEWKYDDEGQKLRHHQDLHHSTNNKDTKKEHIDGEPSSGIRGSPDLDAVSGSSTSGNVDGGSSVGIEKYYKEPSTMTVQERADAAEFHYEEFKSALMELTMVAAEEQEEQVQEDGEGSSFPLEFPELQELLQSTLEDVEALNYTLKESINFMRLVAREGQEHQQQEQEHFSPPPITNILVGEEVEAKVTPGVASSNSGLPTTNTHRNLNADGGNNNAGREKKNRSSTNRRRRTKKRDDSGSFFDLHDDGDKEFNKLLKTAEKEVSRLSGGQGGGGGGLHNFAKQHMRSLLKQASSLGGSEGGAFNHDSFSAYFDADDHHDIFNRGGRRRELATKEEACNRLAQCASGMSIYDYFVYLHSDDIDEATGELDENVFLVPEKDIHSRYGMIQTLTSNILERNSMEHCEDLLQQFHRTVELGDVQQWEGATISQVCQVEGTQIFLDLASMVETLVMPTPTEDIEEFVEDMEHNVQDYFKSAGDTPEVIEAEEARTRREVFNTRDRLLDALKISRRMEAFDFANSIAEEVFNCAADLFASDDRTNDPNFENDENPLGTIDESSFSSPPPVELDPNCSPPNIDGYDIFLGIDSAGFDIDQRRDELRNDIEGLRAECDRTEDCIAFNSDGWLKSSLQPEDMLTRSLIGLPGWIGGDPCVEGLYVKVGVKISPRIFFTAPASFYNVPTGLNMEVRDRFGQLTGRGANLFELTSTFDMLQEYETCMNDSMGQIIRKVNALAGVIEEFSNHPFQFLPTQTEQFPCYRGDRGVICQWLDQFGFLPDFDEDPPMCFGIDSFQSADGSFCCNANNCGGNDCGTHCGDDAQDDSCCSTRERFKECGGDPEDIEGGCTIPESARWYEFAIRGALDEIVSLYDENHCAEDYFHTLQAGIGQVFGEHVSNGYICGIKSAVVKKGKSIPGACCLDAPYELSGEDWGFKYECSMTCQNLAPYFAGMREETCDAYGGVWCPAPADCSRLRECVSDLLASAQAEPNQQAFAMYLSSAPEITDPTDYEQCGATRDYFGFDPDFINDVQICDDVEQLRFTRDFTLLEGFFGVGEDASSEESGGGNSPLENPELPTDNEPDPVPELMLREPPGGPGTPANNSNRPEVQNGEAWRATNFALTQAFAVVDLAIGKLRTLGNSCPIAAAKIVGFVIKGALKAKLVAPVQDKCKKKTLILVSILDKVLFAARLIVAISGFTYGEVATPNNIMAFQTGERISVIYENMVTTGAWLQERFMNLNWYIETETDAVKSILDDQNTFLTSSLENQGNTFGDATSEIAERLDILMDHFGLKDMENDTRRQLLGGGGVDKDISIDDMPSGADSTSGTSGNKADNDNMDPNFHRVQTEILSRAPKQFVCNVIRHKDAELSPTLLALETLDSVSNKMVNVSMEDVVDLGKGRLLVTIPDSSNNYNMYFVDVGLQNDIGEVIAEHSLIVNFASCSTEVN